MFKKLFVFFCAFVCAAPAGAQIYPAPPPVVVRPSTPSADVRSATLTLDALGAATWDVTEGSTVTPFAGVPDAAHIPQAAGTNDLLICNFTTRTATTIAIRCVRLNTLAILLNGLFGGTIAGMKVNIIARYNTPNP